MWWQWILTAMLGGVALAWGGDDRGHGDRECWSVPDLAKVAPLAGLELPRVSIVFSARDEAEKLPAALASFLAVDYPNLEVVAVNDRSVDATREILDAAAKRDARLTVVHITELPGGLAGQDARTADRV